ncbi:hypothetical protein KAR91_68260 [Candidatus Pacearchaeota archaeon]|nr:hypothetical protein [Candidatus Pacearchaeota archaeon]
MTKTQTKQEAQIKLIQAMQIAFMDMEITPEMEKAMSDQMARIEKMFGFIPHSWNRGC